MHERLFWLGAGFAATAAVVVMPPFPAASQTPAGELRCDVSARPGLNIATNREVSCIYRRAHAPLEFYYGYTGFVALDAVAAGAGAAAFYEVLSSDPEGLATLGGEFDAQGLWPGSALAGAPPNPAVLQLVPSSPPPSALAKNVTAAITHLHLNYSGVLHATHRWPEGAHYVPAGK